MNFSQIPPLTMELTALECLKNQCLYFFLTCWLSAERLLSFGLLDLYMLDIGLKETNWSCDPDATNKLLFPLPMQNLALTLDWVNKSVLFYSFHRRNTKNI